MTFAVGHVEGGTRAGWRIVKAAPCEWRCKCTVILQVPNGDNVVRKTQPAYLSSCPDCSARRPS